MLQVTHAGTRDGASAVAGPASAAPLALESLGDSEAESAESTSSLDVESLGDSSSRVGSSGPPFDRESLGDSEASGDSDGSVGDAEAVADGEAEEPPGLPVLPAPPLVPPPEPGLGLAVGELPDDPPPLDGVAVGEGLGDGLGDDEDEEVGDDVGVAVGVEDLLTGGATPGGTAPLD